MLFLINFISLKQGIRGRHTLQGSINFTLKKNPIEAVAYNIIKQRKKNMTPMFYWSLYCKYNKENNEMKYCYNGVLNMAMVTSFSDFINTLLKQKQIVH